MTEVVSDIRKCDGTVFGGEETPATITAPPALMRGGPITAETWFNACRGSWGVVDTAASERAADALEGAVSAYAEWLMAVAAERDAENAFWQNPTERGALDVARARFAAVALEQALAGKDLIWRRLAGIGYSTDTGGSAP